MRRRRRSKFYFERMSNIGCDPSYPTQGAWARRQRFVLALIFTLPFIAGAQISGSSSAEELTFAQLTDAHIFDDGWKKPTAEALTQAANDRAALEWAIQEINRQVNSGTRIDFVVYTGDFGLQNVNFSDDAGCGALPLSIEDGLPATSSNWAAYNVAHNLDKLAVRRVFLVAGNNDIRDEDISDTRVNCFVDELKQQAQTLSQPLDIELLSVSRPIRINGIDIAGMNTASFKKQENYSAACSAKPSTPSQSPPADCPEAQISRIDHLLHTDPGHPVLLFMHVPDMIDPYRHQQNPDERKSSWTIPPSARSVWERAACLPKLIGIFAGHFHDSDHNVYGNNKVTALAVSACVANKTWIAPPLALKNQENASIQGRGFLIARVAGGAVANVQAYWFTDPKLTRTGETSRVGAVQSASVSNMPVLSLIVAALVGFALLSGAAFLMWASRKRAKRAGTHLAPEPGADLKSETWPVLDWSQGRRLESLNILRERAESEAEKATKWYYEKKKSKNWWSRWLRGWAITFTVFAGLVPILGASGVFSFRTDPSHARLLELQFNQFGYIFIGLAAGCIAYDRFFGFSTNWMRYIGAAMRIETARIRFRFEWERLSATGKSGDPEDGKVRDMLETIERFMITIREAIEFETGAWISEFQTNLSQLDKETKALFEVAHRERQAMDEKRRERDQQSAAIEITIKNYERLDPAGWSVDIDNSQRATSIQKPSLLLKSFDAGYYQISVSAHIKGQSVRAEQSVQLKPGELCKVALTFPEPPAERHSV
jgi:SMODS and SLOG-associating 2TM effector domain 2